jgi:hypothetical protein
MAYIQPQVKVFQEFQQMPTSVVANLNAFVFGPNYKLMRYAQASEKALIGLGSYAPDTDTSYAFPNQPTGSAVDLDYVRLYMENVWARYAVITGLSTTKLAVVSPAALNKLRAIPRVEDAEMPDTTDGVSMSAGGYVYGGPELPETFYFTPSGGAVGGVLTRMANSPAAIVADAWDADDAELAYRSESESQRGTVDVLAAANPLTAGSFVQGPHGLVFDLDVGDRMAGLVVYDANPTDDDTITVAGQLFTFKDTVATTHQVQIGANACATYDNLKAAIEAEGLTHVYEALNIATATTDGQFWILGDASFTLAGSIIATTLYTEFTCPVLRKPVVLTFQNTAGTAGFTMTTDPDTLGDSIDRAIDDSTPLRVNYGLGSALSVSLATATRICSIEFAAGVTTLSELRAALVGDSDIAAAFDIGELDAADADELVDEVVDDTGSPATADVNIVMIRDAYRIRVFPNDVTFATANGYNHSAHFKSRGVRVGDRLRYSVVGADAVTYEGTTRVAALEADTLAAKINTPTVDTDNDATQAGDQLIPHTGLDIVIPGTDNQLECDGSETAVYALNATNLYYPGNYSAGLLSDTYTITITAGGAVGSARATVTTASGAYTRTLVPITAITWGHAQATHMGMLDIGNNLWVVLHDTGTLEFEVGDTYTFSRAITAPWAVVSAARMTSGGTYTGPVDTTYMLKVVRGGVFDRTVNVTDGMHGPNMATLTYTTSRPTAGQLVTIGGVVFEFVSGGSPSGSNIAVNVAGSANIDADWALFVAAVNASPAALYASQDTATSVVTIRGSYASITGATTDAPGTWVVKTLQLNASLDFDAGEWNVGDVDDEYVLTCTQAGTLTNARFALTSLLSDNQTAIEFTGTGAGSAETVGNAGLSVYFAGSAGTPTLSVGDYWVIKVNATRPRIQVTDTAGVDQSDYVVVDNGVEFDVGQWGVRASFTSNGNTEGGFCTNGGLITGDVFYISAEAVSAGPVKTLVLADDLPAAVTTGLEVDDSGAVATYTANYAPSLCTANLYLVQAAATISAAKLQSPPDYNWEADADGVTVNSAIAVQDTAWTEVDGSMPYLPVYTGTMYLEYRALLTAYADTIYSLSDISDVVTELGAVHPDNPLAQGVYNALANSGEQPVYFMGVPTDDLAGYSAVLDQAAKTDVVYGLAPLSRDMTVLSAVAAHIAALSGETSKRWRLAFVGTALPVDSVVYDSTTFTPAGTAWIATVTDNPAVIGTRNTVVTVTNGTPTLSTDVAVGDEVRVNFATDAWGNETYETYVVAQVLSNTKLVLASGPSAPINVAAKIEISHPNSAAEIATAVAARSTYFGSRRMYHVFPDTAYMGTTPQTAEFIAAAMVGLLSSVPPQQGLTNITVTGFSNLPSVYGTYTNAQLNEMAAGGTFILMQDMSGGEIYVRHQVSTATADGNLLTTELNVTKNLDAISYYFAGILAPFIGRYNITPELLVVLRTQIKNGLNYLASDQTGAGLLGPMLVGGEDTAIRSLAQHPTLRDQVAIVVDLQLPMPMNVIQLRLVV